MPIVYIFYGLTLLAILSVPFFLFLIYKTIKDRK